MKVARAVLTAVALIAIAQTYAVAQGKTDVPTRSGGTFSSLRAKAAEALAYCKAHGLDTGHCILVDFSIPSGRKRLFVWNFTRDTVEIASLCAHGCGRSSTVYKPEFSNEPGSYCSSLGHYRTGERAYSQYGIHVHYKLYGLDRTNSNAFKRSVVLHSFGPVPETEIFPDYLPMGYSLGCTVVSNGAMRGIDALLKKKTRPVLLWIYAN